MLLNLNKRIRSNSLIIHIIIKLILSVSNVFIPNALFSAFTFGNGDCKIRAGFGACCVFANEAVVTLAGGSEPIRAAMN